MRKCRKNKETKSDDARKHPKKYHQFPFNGSQEGINIHFQWLYRNTIEKMEKKTLADIRKYHNSDEYQAAAYYQFVNDTEYFLRYFDQKSRDMYQEARNNLGFSSGVLQQYAPPQVSTNYSGNIDKTYYFDNLDGVAFEQYCASLLEKNGFCDVTLTPHSGDQGVDIIATKDGVRYAIQCKCYSSDLGNTPIQEVATGKNIYNCHVGVVLTNRYFTEGAKVAAKATGTLLWDRDKLISMFKD